MGLIPERSRSSSMTIWDILHALSGLDDYVGQFNKDRELVIKPRRELKPDQLVRDELRPGDEYAIANEIHKEKLAAGVPYTPELWKQCVDEAYIAIAKSK